MHFPSCVLKKNVKNIFKIQFYLDVTGHRLTLVFVSRCVFLLQGYLLACVICSHLLSKWCKLRIRKVSGFTEDQQSSYQNSAHWLIHYTLCIY